MKLPFGRMRDSYAGMHVEIDSIVTHCSEARMDVEITEGVTDCSQ
jgi:hypothetical protein